MNFVRSLRRELMERAQQYAVTHGTSYCLSYGQTRQYASTLLTRLRGTEILFPPPT
jgi:hypothetical protein